MRKTTAATVQAKLLEAQERIGEAFAVAMDGASAEENRKLRDERAVAMSAVQPMLDAIDRKHPTLRRVRRQPALRTEAPPANVSRDCAICAQAQLFQASGLLDWSIVTVMHQLSTEEFIQYRRLVGKTLGELYEVLQWLWARHPDIQPGSIGRGPAKHLHRPSSPGATPRQRRAAPRKAKR
jgi:hypothetical protein